MSSPNAPPDKRRVASQHSKRLCSRLREIEQLRSSIWIVIIIWSQSYFELQIKIWKRTRSSQWNEQAKRLKKNPKTKNQAWPGIEPWRLRWLDATLYPLRKYMIHSYITTFISDNVASSQRKCQGSIPGHARIFSVSFSTALRLFISLQKTCSLRSCSLSWSSLCSIFIFVSSQSNQGSCSR